MQTDGPDVAASPTRLAAALGSRAEPLARTAFRGLTRGLVAAHARTGLGHVAGRPGNAIVSFHAVGEDPEEGYVDGVSTARFRRVVRTLATTREVVRLDEVTGTDDGQRVAITFDDGLRSVYTEALPVLREFDVPATVFVNPAFVGDRRTGLLERRHGIDPTGRVTMTDAEVRELAADPRIDLGNHTATHPDLASLDDEGARRVEIVDARDALEARYDVSVDAFAYPYGSVDPASRALVERTHDLSVTTQPYLVEPGRSGHHLPRLNGASPHRRLRWELAPASDLLHGLRERYVAASSDGDHTAK